jgi:hypothetical protein
VTGTYFDTLGIASIFPAVQCKNNGWYNWNTLLRLIQACGRSIRSKDDYAATYIIDSKFRHLLSQTTGKVPAWFMESIQKYNDNINAGSLNELSWKHETKPARELSVEELFRKYGKPIHKKNQT